MTKRMKKVVGFGDFLVRLGAPGYQRFIQCNQFDINYTGAEANVCVSLSMMGIETEFVTRLPDNDIARAGLATLRKYGVGVSHVAFGGERMGAFYVEKGASQRPGKVVYDRKYTSIATSKPEDFNWDAIFQGAERLHMTGITPALSETMPEVFAHAISEARKRGVKASCDLNYRKNMWTESQAKACMEKVLPSIDLVIANEEDAEKVLGIKAEGSNVVSGQLSHEGYVDVARSICERYGVPEVAITLRKSISASDNEWAALLYTDNRPYFSRNYSIHIVDRVGGGDSFCAGLLYGKVKGFDPQRNIEYAAAASCLKHSIEMDFNLSSVEEVERLMSGDGSGRVLR
jgi:2-dehydro-3-deoxygluconokinase